MLEKLYEAIEGQQKVVTEAASGVSRERGNWQANERKRMSFDALASRELKKEQQRDNKRDQKQNDEFAARLTQTKRI